MKIDRHVKLKLPQVLYLLTRADQHLLNNLAATLTMRIDPDQIVDHWIVA